MTINSHQGLLFEKFMNKQLLDESRDNAM